MARHKTNAEMAIKAAKPMSAMCHLNEDLPALSDRQHQSPY
ncbi:hypothetical protein [Nitrosomonas ureae]|uniref:Uncharacterized protein n=1 Tax=Nitrosomonas ureae TaxID=44577 RepID=A0A286AFH1_9PROT|nr:hypothetical protein [Nitrosomonas ureae]SOD20648.1 hypothetical protein SAMN06297164_2695 [Nitrosomonas ureae]